MTVLSMKSPKYRVIKLKKKTQAQGFKDIQPGDILEFSTPLIAKYNYKHIVTVNVYKENGDKAVLTRTFNQLDKIIDNFELVELDEMETE